MSLTPNDLDRMLGYYKNTVTDLTSAQQFLTTTAHSFNVVWQRAATHYSIDLPRHYILLHLHQQLTKRRQVLRDFDIVVPHGLDECLTKLAQELEAYKEK